MLAPPGTTFEERESSGGWGSLGASYEGVVLYAIGKQGTFASAEEIEKFGVQVTGISAGNWQHVDSGKNQRGLKWFKTVKSTRGNIGSKGSYRAVIKTTATDYQNNKKAYHKWYRSIRVH